MKNKKLLIVWCISLMVIAVCTLVIAVANILGGNIPDMLVRILGTFELIACPVMMFATVRMYNKGREEKKEEV